MNDAMKLFSGVKNVEFEGHTYVEEIGAELPLFTLVDIPADRWNAMAKESNTKAFIELVGRQPVDYKEVLTWVYSLIPGHKENHLGANEMATVID
jgi:hypothetical protein